MIRHALIFWISIVLAVWGLVTDFMAVGLRALTPLILPLVLLGLVYYAYKAGAQNAQRGRSGTKMKVKPSQKTMSKVAGVRKSGPAAGKRKSYPFQVIEGSKGKNEDNLPKYH